MLCCPWSWIWFLYSITATLLRCGLQNVRWLWHNAATGTWRGGESRGPNPSSSLLGGRCWSLLGISLGQKAEESPVWRGPEFLGCWVSPKLAHWVCFGGALCSKASAGLMPSSNQVPQYRPALPQSSTNTSALTLTAPLHKQLSHTCPVFLSFN